MNPLFRFRVPDVRPLSERYDFRALTQALSELHCNLAESFTDWVSLAATMAALDLPEDDFLLLSCEASTYNKSENQKLFANKARKTKQPERSARRMLGLAKRQGIDVRRFYKPDLTAAQPVPATGSAPAAGQPAQKPLAEPQPDETVSESYPEPGTLGPVGQDLVRRLFRALPENNFVLAMARTGVLTARQLEHAREVYRLGNARKGFVVFWRIDEQGRVCDGKLMLYGPDGHRLKNVRGSVGWISNKLRYERNVFRAACLPKGWKTRPCLFGQHLLTAAPPDQPVALVESEKTAVICSERMATEGYLWMATGGVSFLSAEVLRPLSGRKVCVFPDTDSSGQTFRHWACICLSARRNLAIDLHLMDILERCATPEQKARKIDIADFLLES
ncbi:MAG: hypothetical protein J6P82_00765 [Bacteroidales bacterium]|nr:hypothetical protein [Bacteroidales bacterium]